VAESGPLNGDARKWWPSAWRWSPEEEGGPEEGGREGHAGCTGGSLAGEEEGWPPPGEHARGSPPLRHSPLVAFWRRANPSTGGREGRAGAGVGGDWEGEEKGEGEVRGRGLKREREDGCGRASGARALEAGVVHCRGGANGGPGPAEQNLQSGRGAVGQAQAQVIMEDESWEDLEMSEEYLDSDDAR